ncbi:hypothetical protein HYV70_05755 [Candidatus Uhrbacteria bacterium]|nr:hypothetical protein [Candidatus Uhrbacteria bacterium]
MNLPSKPNVRMEDNRLKRTFPEKIGLGFSLYCCGFVQTHVDFDSTSAEDHDRSNSQKETVVVPTSIVVDFVHANFVREQGRHQREHGDNPMPHTVPKTRGIVRNSRCGSCEIVETGKKIIIVMKH